MRQSRKRILYFFGGVTGIFILVFLLLFLSGSSYRSRLPVYPDFKSVAPTLQEQISKAERTAWWFPSADNLGNLGMVYHSATFYAEAAKCYQLAIQKDKKQWIWNYYLGQLNRQQSEFQKAFECFSEVVKADPSNIMANYYLAESCQSLANMVEAEKLYLKVTGMTDPNLSDAKSGRENYFSVQTYARYNLARIYSTTNRLKEAELLLKNILQEQLRFGPAYRLLGNVYAQKGETSLSNYYLIRAKDLGEYAPPSDPLMDQLILTSRSELYLLKEIDLAVYNNNLQFALQLCDHSMQFIPDDKFLIYKSVRVYLATKNDQKALALLGRHFINFKEDYDEMMDIADRLFAKGYAAEALNFFLQAKKLKPQNPYLPIWLSKYNLIKEATELLHEQMAKEPANPEIISNAVIISMDRGEKEMAKSYLNKLKSLSPKYPDIKRYEGYFAEQEGNSKEVIACWEEVLRLQPKDIRIIGDLGNFFLKNKMFSDAKCLYLKALENNPNVPFLQDELSKLLVFCPDEKIRDLRQCLEYAERAFINITSDPKIRLSAAANLATANAMLGDKKQAAKYIDITLTMAKKENVLQDYLSYFDGLKKQYGL